MVRTVVPTSEETGQIWRYTFNKPADEWFEVGFDDSGWCQGPGGFGTKGTPGAVVRTTWNTPDIWLRRDFDIAEVTDNISLRIHYDEDARVYINGAAVAKLDGYSGHYVSLDLDEKARGTLRSGKNVLAVRCHQTYGGQYVDVGFESVNRWSQARVWQWYRAQKWPCGFNYIPANAISYTEMWMGYCFDEKRIDVELALAESVGFNCVRVVLPYVVWEHEPEAFKKRLARFLEICDKHGIKVMFTLFDDCHFASDEKLRNPVYGKQPDVIEGWYANGWTPSPGHSMVRDSKQWPKLERYVRDVIGTFRNDERVLCWDLYNEPTNSGLGDVSVPLAECVFGWARQVNPAQPLTVGQWNGNALLNGVVFRYSDVITFHDYGSAEGLASHIEMLEKHGRPMINTEWLNRGRGSVVATCLPVFRKKNVGCMHWGLVNGKTQTDLPWGHRPGDPEPEVWQHDLYRGDFRPYDKAEVDAFKKAIRQGTAHGPSEDK
jgi:hypothetical protein